MSAHDSSFSDFIQQVKDTVDLERLVRDYVPTLERSGTSFKGCCPFHNEKTPSFYIHPQMGYYKCFGCGASGDVIKFVQEIEKVDFMMALEQLARRANLQLPSFSGGMTREKHDEAKLKALREACDWAEQFFIRQLGSHPRGKIAREYLHKRGLTDEEIETYRLGYAPEGYEVLIGEATKRGWTLETLAEAGLVSRTDHGFCDRFRDRVMFPITDRMGQVVAFGGRILESADKVAKYINTAETPIFKKNRMLYGMFPAREAIKNEGFVILLEGYMDWIAMHRRGFKNVLAGMGTALTDGQCRMIRQIAPRVVLLYDGDSAGQKAMFRSAELLLAQGLQVHSAVLPVEHDPDTLLEAEGKAAMAEILDKAPTTIDYFIDLATVENDVVTPEGKAAAVDRIAPLLRAVEEPVLAEGYARRAAQNFNLTLETLQKVMRSEASRRRKAAAKPKPAPVEMEYPPDIPPPEAWDDDYYDGPPEGFEEFDRPMTAPVSPTRATATEQYALYILFKVLERPDWLARIQAEWFMNPLLRNLFEQYRQAQKDVAEGGDPVVNWFEVLEHEAEREWLSRILFIVEQKFGNPALSDDSMEQAFQMQCLKLKKQWTKHRNWELQQTIRMIRADEPPESHPLTQIHENNRVQMNERAEFLNSWTNQTN